MKAKKADLVAFVEATAFSAGWNAFEAARLLKKANGHDVFWRMAQEYRHFSESSLNRLREKFPADWQLIILQARKGVQAGKRIEFQLRGAQ